MKRRLIETATAVVMSATTVIMLLCVLGRASTGGTRLALAVRLLVTPTVTLVNPAVVANELDSPIVITGSDFAAVLSGTVVITSPTVLLDSTALPDVGYVSSTTLTSTVPAGFPTGVYTVTVANPDGLTGSLPGGLTVSHPAPILQGVSPGSGIYGQAIVLTITGTRLIATPTVALDGISCPGVGFVSSTTLTATLPGGLLPGVYDLIVRNPGPGDPQDVLADVFTLYSPVPVLTAVAPRSGPNDLDIHVVITGTSFVPTPTMTLGSTQLRDMTWLSPTCLAALVPWGMDPGTYSLTVTNPGPGEPSAALSDVFTISQGLEVWNTSELYGGTVQQVVINPVTPTTLYALTESPVGLFRSRDAGDSWSFQFASAVQNLVIDHRVPSRHYMCGLGVLYRSDDEGDTWTALNPQFPFTETQDAHCYGWIMPYVHPVSDTVYAIACGAANGYQSGMLRSEDHGQTWDPITSGITDTQITAMAFHPDDPNTLYIGTGNGHIFRSTDGGASWAYASTPIGFVGTLEVNPFGDHEVWASVNSWYGDSCAIVKSTNADLTTWTAVEPEPGQQICAASIDFAPTISGTVFVAGPGGVSAYKTTDAGDTWDRLGPETGANDIALHPTDPDTAYIGEGYYGVYRTTDGGTTWEVTNQGLTALYPRQLQVGPDRPDIVYALVGTGDVYRGVQGGEAWHRLPISRVDSILIDPITPTRVYAGMDYNDPYVGISDDRGQTWSASAFLQPPTQYAGYAHFIVSLLAIPGHPGTLLAGCAHISSSPEDAPGSIYRTTDYGEHWDQVIPTGTQEINEVVAMTFDPMTPTIIYAAARASGMLRSTDGGQTWQSTGESVAAMDVVKSIAVETVPPYRVYAMTAYPYGELYYSEDHGLSWTQATSPIGPQNVLHILWTGPAPRLLYSASLRGLSRSMDGGQSWQRAAGALGYVPVYALASVTTTDRMILYAGTTGGEVGEAGARMLGGQNDDVPLLNAGVYRYTTRRLGVQVFLPLVLRAYAQ